MNEWSVEVPRAGSSTSTIPYIVPIDYRTTFYGILEAIRLKCPVSTYRGVRVLSARCQTWTSVLFHGGYPRGFCLASEAMVILPYALKFVPSFTQKAWNMHSVLVLSGVERSQPGRPNG